MTIEQLIREIRNTRTEILFLNDLLLYIESKEELEQMIRTRLENLESYLQEIAPNENYA